MQKFRSFGPKSGKRGSSFTGKGRGGHEGEARGKSFGAKSFRKPRDSDREEFSERRPRPSFAKGESKGKTFGAQRRDEARGDRRDSRRGGHAGEAKLFWKERDSKRETFGDKKPRSSFGKGERQDKKFGGRRPRPAFDKGERQEKDFGAKRYERSEFQKPRRDRDEFKKPRREGRDETRRDAPRFGKGRFDRRDGKKNFGKSAPRAFAEPEAKVLPSRKGILIWGLHAVREAWLNPDRDCFQIWATASSMESLSAAFEQAGEKQLSRPEPSIVDRETIEKLLPTGSVHQGVAIEVAPLAETPLYDLLQQAPDLLVVLDQVTDPHNIGAILRSCAAFGAGGLIMTERNAPATTGVMAKTACGAMEHVPQIVVVNLVRTLAELQQAGYWCVGLAEEAARDLSALDMSGKTALVLGAEGEGLRRLTREHCDELARLPTGGAIGSLNVSNAAAVGLYEARRQKKSFAG